MPEDKILKTIKEQLDESEKVALSFFKGAVTGLNPGDPDDHKLVTHSKQAFYLFITYIGIDKLKKVLSDIVITLNAKKEAEETIENYNGLDKSMLTQKLQYTEVTYIKYLKSICNAHCFDQEYYNLLIKTDNASRFESITNAIKYYKIIERLHDEEKYALAFLEDLIANFNLNDTNDCNKFVTHTKQTFYQFILNTDDIDKLKVVLSGIATTLNVKESSGRAIVNYNGPVKDILIQKLQDAETNYISYLRSICNTSFLKEMYDNLLSKANHASEFESIGRTISFYSQMIDQLNNEQKEALAFLENAITISNSGDPFDDFYIIHTKQALYQFILDVDDIDTLKVVLSGIQKTLEVKETVGRTIENYSEPGKDILIQKLQDAETNYISYLRSICNTSFLKEMYDNLLSKANHASEFESIERMVSFYSQIMEQLNDDHKKALTFLVNAIINSTLYDKFIQNVGQNIDIDTFKVVLSGIQKTLEVKETVGRAIENYSEPGKDILIQKLQDAETNYISYLRSICNTSFLKEMYDNLLSKANHASEFESIERMVSFYSQIMEQLNDDHKKALTFLVNAMINSTLYDKFIQNIGQNIDIDTFKVVLSGIQKTLDVKEAVGRAIENYSGPIKDILIQKLQDAETNYISYLRIICNTSFLKEMYDNLLSKANHASEFESIERTISFYSQIMEQLNDDHKKALTFLENVIINGSYDQGFVIRIKEDLSRFLLDTYDIDKFKSALLNIARTLNVQETAERAIENYSSPGKDILVSMLEDKRERYISYLRNICHISSFEEIYDLLSREAKHVSEFESIERTITFYNSTYSSVIKQLSVEEKDALTFFLESVVMTNPDPDDNDFIIHILDNFSRFVKDIGINKLKKVLSSISITLNSYREAEFVIANYNGQKNVVEQIFKDEKVRYREYLKSVFDTEYGSWNDVYDKLIQEKYDTFLLEAIINGIYSCYNAFDKVIEQLNFNEKDALMFFEKVVTKPNLDDPDYLDYNEFLIHIEENFNRFIRGISIDKLKTILLQIVLTLNTKKIAEEAIVKYNKPGKNILLSKLENKGREYIKRLKNIFNLFSVKDVYNKLLNEANNSSQFESIVRTVSFYNSIIGKLNSKGRDALTFLENSIINTNLDDSDDCKLMTYTKDHLDQFILGADDIGELQTALSGIVTTLNVKKDIEVSLNKYTQAGKYILAQKLKDTEIKYMKHLKSIFNVFSLKDMYNKLLNESDHSFQFEIIEKAISSYNYLLEELNDEEKKAFIFLEDSIVKPNPDDPDDAEITISIKRNFDQLIRTVGIARFKMALKDIEITLNSKKGVEEVIARYNIPEKHIFMQILKDTEVKFMKYLKSVCNTSFFREIYDNLLYKSNSAFSFTSIATTVTSYNSIVESLNNEEKAALTYIEDSITNSYSDDFNDDDEITVHMKQNYSRFIQNTYDIQELKSALKDIVITLNAKKEAKEALKEYTIPKEHIFVQIFEDIEIKYMKHLKSIFNIFSFKDVYNKLFNEANNLSQFESITDTVKSYNSIVERLSNEEKAALTFLENSITTPKSDDLHYHEIVVQIKQNNYKQLILDTCDNINRLKEVLFDIEMTLNSRNEAYLFIASYNGLDKDILKEKIGDLEIEYVEYLKIMCNTSSLTEMCDNLLHKSNNASNFTRIADTVKFYNIVYNSIVERLSNGERAALIFLENSIKTYNPDDSYDFVITVQAKQNYSRFIQNTDDINEFKSALKDIVITLNAKKEAEEALKQYTKPGKNVLAQRLEDAIAMYVKHLKSICNTFSVKEMLNNLSSKTNNASKFVSIVTKIESYNTTYNNLMEGLSDDERCALIFFEDSITNPYPDDLNSDEITVQMKQNYSRFMQNTGDINEFKSALKDIVITLNAKKEAEEALEQYTKPGKDILAQRLEDATAIYVKHLKSICNTSSVKEIYDNLSIKTNHASRFVSIVTKIKSYNTAYNNLIEKLSKDERDALTFLESSVTMCDPNGSEFITHTKDSFYLFILEISISRLKAALKDIVMTLNAEKEAEEVLENYFWADKNQFVQRLQNEKANYIKHLRKICNTYYFDEMYDNLLIKTNNAFQFVIIVICVKFYKKLIIK
ncbi:BTA121 domain-containing protein surface lipoprotein [Borrelia persica]|uniref:BTA121 domain-containing protein surface lipoprotein n=1 Tax=Borrelia persica TaxID=44448 RepID=UPI000466F5DC|nr:hypothetical protein [Borrelia persica]